MWLDTKNPNFVGESLLKFFNYQDRLKTTSRCSLKLLDEQLCSVANSCAAVGTLLIGA
jgi:hypothetical protein